MVTLEEEAAATERAHGKADAGCNKKGESMFPAPKVPIMSPCHREIRADTAGSNQASRESIEMEKSSCSDSGIGENEALSAAEPRPKRNVSQENDNRQDPCVSTNPGPLRFSDPFDLDMIRSIYPT